MTDNHQKSAFDTIIENPYFQKYVRDSKSDGDDLIIVLKNAQGQWCVPHRSLFRTTDDDREYSANVPEKWEICNDCGDFVDKYGLINCHECGWRYCCGCMYVDDQCPHCNTTTTL